MFQFQRLQHGGGDIRAASHGLGEDHLRTVGAQLVGGPHQVRKAAAETAAGHLRRLDAARFDEARVHQFRSLVVQQRRRLHAPGGQPRAAATIREVFPAPRNPPMGTRVGRRSPPLVIAISTQGRSPWLVRFAYLRVKRQVASRLKHAPPRLMRAYAGHALACPDHSYRSVTMVAPQPPASAGASWKSATNPVRARMARTISRCTPMPRP